MATVTQIFFHTFFSIFFILIQTWKLLKKNQFPYTFPYSVGTLQQEGSQKHRGSIVESSSENKNQPSESPAATTWADPNSWQTRLTSRWCHPRDISPHTKELLSSSNSLKCMKAEKLMFNLNHLFLLHANTFFKAAWSGHVCNFPMLLHAHTLWSFTHTLKLHTLTTHTHTLLTLKVLCGANLHWQSQLR